MMLEMYNIRFLLLVAFFHCQTLSVLINAQSSDTPIITVGKAKVSPSEFIYIYQKNNGAKADFSEKSLLDYADSYSKFKLKVEEGKFQNLDKDPKYIEELNGYREKLAKSYLGETIIKDRIIEEIISRKKQDVSFKHILIKVPKNTTDAVRQKAKKKIDEIYAKTTPSNFGEMAKKYSQDARSLDTEGNLGFWVAPMSEGYYELENAIYTVPLNTVSKPFLTDAGYHIVIPIERRLAVGEVAVSQILIKKINQGKNFEGAKKLVDSLHQLLEVDPERFKELAKEFSQDRNTFDGGGYMGFFGLKTYNTIFENAAFSLTFDGEISKPVETDYGYHLIKREGLMKTFNEKQVRADLKNSINKSNERYQKGTKEHINHLKKDYNFFENRISISKLKSKIDSTFVEFDWKMPISKDLDVFTLNKTKKFYSSDFIEYCIKNSKRRNQFSYESYKQAINVLFDEFVDNSLEEMEEAELETNNPEFHNIMREYREGILMFEITQKEVWDQAAKDEKVLVDFYENNKGRFLSSDKVSVKTYKLNSVDYAKISQMFKQVHNGINDNKILEDLNKEVDTLLEIIEEPVMMTDLPSMNLDYISAPNSAPDIHHKEGFTLMRQIMGKLPNEIRPYNECKGLVISEYQDFLEDEWLKKLEKKYPIKINETAIKSLIQHDK